MLTQKQCPLLSREFGKTVKDHRSNEAYREAWQYGQHGEGDDGDHASRYEVPAGRSAGLLKEAGLHGPKYAIDAMVAEVALRLPGPVAVLTSDADHMVKLCGRRVRVIGP